MFRPFGREVVGRERVTGRHNVGTGAVGLVMNIVWLLLAGWYVALTHLLIAAGEAITLIGLSFAFKDL